MSSVEMGYLFTKWINKQNRDTFIERQQAGSSGDGGDWGAGGEGEGLRTKEKKRRELMDTDNSVATSGW